MLGWHFGNVCSDHLYQFWSYQTCGTLDIIQYSARNSLLIQQHLNKNETAPTDHVTHTHTHTHNTHKHTHARTHTHTHARTHPRTHALLHADMYIQTNAHKLAHINTGTDAGKHTNIPSTKHANKQASKQAKQHQQTNKRARPFHWTWAVGSMTRAWL